MGWSQAGSQASQPVPCTALSQAAPRWTALTLIRTGSHTNASAGEGRGRRGHSCSMAPRGECEGLLQPRGGPGVRAVGAAGPGEEEQRPAPSWQRGPHPCVQAPGAGLGSQACGLKPTSTTLPSPSLGCAFSHHSDLRPAASLTPPGSVDSPPDCPCPPGSLLTGQAGRSNLQGCVPALALLVLAFAHSVPPPGMHPCARP